MLHHNFNHRLYKSISSLLLTLFIGGWIIAPLCGCNRDTTEETDQQSKPVVAPTPTNSAPTATPTVAPVLAPPQDKEVYEQARTLVLAQFKNPQYFEVLHFDEEVKQHQDLERGEDQKANEPVQPVSLVSQQGNEWKVMGLLGYSGTPGYVTWGQGTVYLKGSEESISHKSTAGWNASLSRNPTTGEWTLVKLTVQG